MVKIKILFGLLSILLMINCATTGVNTARFEWEKAHKTAVLNFTSEGFIGVDQTGRFAADEISRGLFQKQGIPVVDRSVVIAKCAELQLTPIINQETLVKLAKALDVDLLILGSLIRLDKAEIGEDDNQKAQIQMTVRILSGRTGEVVGLVTCQKSKKGLVNDLIADLSKQVVHQIKL